MVQPTHAEFSLGQTPINILALEAAAATYPDQAAANLLTNGFRFGFLLRYSGPRVFSNCKNLLSIKGNEKLAYEIISKEIKLGRVAGPFTSRPLHTLRVSPIGLIPKKDGHWRLIHHLSYPEGKSVNDYIDENVCSVHYTSFDKVVDMVSKLGQGALLSKMDVKSAFRLLPIHPSDFELLGFKLEGCYYFDKCLPFGCAISCALFEKFSTFLEWLVIQRSGQDNVCHYLDDFLFGGKAECNSCIHIMETFQSCCLELGVPLAADKTVLPTPILTFLGLQLDTIDMMIKIPPNKLYDLETKLSQMLIRKKTTLKELQSLVGSLNFCARAIPSFRAFNRRFYDAMSGISQPHHFIRITLALKEDIKVWLAFLHDFNGHCYFPDIQWMSNEKLQLFSDSAGGSSLGCAAYFAPHWAYVSWPSSWKGTASLRDVSFLELVPIVLAFHIWGRFWENRKIVLNTDNHGLVYILNKKSSKSLRVMALLRPLVLLLMQYNIQIQAVHILGCKNTITDSLSRHQWARFRRLAPEADAEPAVVPELFLRLLSTVKPSDC